MKTITKAMLVGVGAAATAGVAYVILRRKGLLSGVATLSGSSGLGRAALVDVNRKGGMTLKHRRGKMPIKERVGIIQDLVWEGVQDPQMRELALAITGKGERRVQVGKYNFDVKGAACPARDGECESRAVYNWVRANIRYTGDIGPVKMGRKGPVEAVDLFQSAKRTAEFGGGDCDDHTIINTVLMSTLLAMNGLTAKVRVAEGSQIEKVAKGEKALAGAKLGRGEFDKVRGLVKHRVTAPRQWSEWAHVYTVVGLPKNNPTKWVALDTTLPGNYFGVEAPAAKKIDFPA